MGERDTHIQGDSLAAAVPPLTTMASIRVAPSRAQRAINLLRTVNSASSSCPCHSNPQHHHNAHPSLNPFAGNRRRLATPMDTSQQKEYAFEMAASSIRFGPGCTKEVGMDFKNLGAKKVMVVTDETVRKLDAMKQVQEGLDREGIPFEVFSKTRVEPKDYSIREAIDFAKPYAPDAFLAVGGGSVIDTAKLMNLYTTCPEADFLDLVDKKAKTGIAHRNLKPTLGICDPINTRTMPSAVHASSGLDVLCHALESWTAIPYNERTPRPDNPINRPAYQGANPISDIFSLQALRSTVQCLPRAVKDPDDWEAQSNMLLAATLAGVGFGNAGVHLCHGMSYPISSQNPGYKHVGYDVTQPIIPHGVSVAVTAPAVFKYTGASNPERHLQAAEAFGVDTSRVKKESAGEVLSEALANFLVKLGDQPRGLKALGFNNSHVDMLVEGTIPQKRVLMLAPNLDVSGGQEEREQLRGLFEDAMQY